MRRTNKKKSKLVTVLTAVLFLLVVAAVIGLIVRFTGADKEVDKYFGDFRIEYNGETLTGTENSITLPESGQARFEVKGTNGYTVKVIPNADFYYTVGNQTYNFRDEDITQAIINADNVYKNAFVIDCFPEYYSLQNVLSRIWNGAEVSFEVENLLFPYRINVISANGETISFGLGQVFNVQDITLNYTEIEI